MLLNISAENAENLAPSECGPGDVVNSLKFLHQVGVLTSFDAAASFPTKEIPENVVRNPLFVRLIVEPLSNKPNDCFVVKRVLVAATDLGVGQKLQSLPKQMRPSI